MIRLSIIFLIIASTSLHAQSDTNKIKEHFKKILNTKKPRNYKNTTILDNTANYIFKTFEKYADSVYLQTYNVYGSIYSNVVAVFGSEFRETIVIGAHYDVCNNQDGADDNASGTIGLLEIARMLKNVKINNRIELVAYTLEEPPFFRTEYMGSYIHAKSLKDKKAAIIGMICLEMIGYFDDSKGSQDYPLGILKWIYGRKGDYITLVNKFRKGEFSRKFTRKFKKAATIKTKKFTGPKTLPGIDFSDHLNYWAFGYSALMITDTAFYRNQNYHKKSDTLETIDIKRMSLVIDSVLSTLKKMN